MTANPTIKQKRLRFLAFLVLVIHSANSVLYAEDSDQYFYSELKEVKQSMLKAEHWKSNLQKSGLLLTSAEIQKQNTILFRTNSHMNDLSQFPASLSQRTIYSRITKASKKPSSNRYLASGDLVSQKRWEGYLSSLNLLDLDKDNNLHQDNRGTIKTQFALVVKRTSLRTFPTDDAVFKKPHEINLDRFQETALFPTEVVTVLHDSLDGLWVFLSNYNYSGWVKKEDIAFATKEDVFNFSKSNNSLTITGDKVFTNFNPHNSKVSQVQLDMGTNLPLVNKKLIPNTLGGQNTLANYVIYLPTRNSSGRLEIQMALISRNKDVRIGFLPLTKSNILDQSFKFLGERYGWGHSFNARDCTGFVGDIYKSFGILMPRNTGQQATSNQGQNIRFAKSATNDEKLKEIRKLSPGDLIYIPGHVMIFLGLEENQPYIIHDVSGLSYYNKDGDYIQSKLNGVSVTPLLPLQLNAEKSYLDDIYTLKKLR